MKLYHIETSEGLIYVVARDEPEARDAAREYFKERHFSTAVTIREIKELADTVSRGFTPKLIIP